MIDKLDFQDVIHGFIATSVHMIKNHPSGAPGEADFVDFAWRLTQPTVRTECLDIKPSLQRRLGDDHEIFIIGEEFEFRKIWAEPQENDPRMEGRDSEGRICITALVRVRDAKGEVILITDIRLKNLDGVQEAITASLEEVSPGFDDGMLHLHIDRDGGTYLQVGDAVKKMADEAIDREVESFKSQLDDIFGEGR